MEAALGQPGGSLALTLSVVAAAFSTAAAALSGWAVWSNGGARVAALERSIATATATLATRMQGLDSRMEQEHQMYVSLAERADEQLDSSETARKRAQQDRWRAERARGEGDDEQQQQQLPLDPAEARDQAKREIAARLRAVG
jgi:hypothetical protein